jgi:hypothetical protein
MPRLKNIKVSLKLPYIGGIEGTWEPDESERKAAWELYVELVTRISVTELQPHEGVLREALSSLYTLFDTTRTILRTYGPGIAQPKGGNPLSFGSLAVTMLNVVIRPVLAQWHPMLLTHERQWEKGDELRRVLNEVREVLIAYANVLAQVADVPSLIVTRA